MDIRRCERDRFALHLKLTSGEDGTAVALLLAQAGKCRLFNQFCKGAVFDGEAERSLHAL